MLGHLYLYEKVLLCLLTSPDTCISWVCTQTWYTGLVNKGGFYTSRLINWFVYNDLLNYLHNTQKKRLDCVTSIIYQEMTVNVNYVKPIRLTTNIIIWFGMHRYAIIKKKAINKYYLRNPST